MGTIYAIKNNRNGMTYVGATASKLKKRISQHLYDTKKQNTNMKLHAEIRKHKWESFSYFSLENGVLKKNLDERERYWIKELNTLRPHGYNSTEGGKSLFGKENNFYGKTHSKETKDVLSEMASLRKGRKNPFFGKCHSDDARKKMAKAREGSRHTEDHLKRMSKRNSGEGNPFHGKRHSEESKKKISDKAITKDIVGKTKSGDEICFRTSRKASKYVIKNFLCRTNTKEKTVMNFIVRAVKNNGVAYGIQWSKGA